MAGSACVGCGLDVTPGGVLEVATSGEFADINTDSTTCRDIDGQIVFCDRNGQLRTAPEKHVRRASDGLNENIGRNGDGQPGSRNGNEITVATGEKVTITNPSPCYDMFVNIDEWASVDLEFAAANETYSIRRQYRSNFGTNVTGDWSYDETQSVRLNATDEITAVLARPRSSISIPPGGSYTAQVRIRASVNKPDNNGNAQANDSRITQARIELHFFGVNA